MVIPTPHIAAGRGDFAELVLMPGDPLRARHLAEALLRDAREVSAVRNMLAYTGRWRGNPVSVMGSGMGIPSLSIYATELAREYGVRRVVRIGTCGALQDSLALGDLVLAAGAGTDSRVNRLRCRGHDFAALASYPLLSTVADAARRAGIAAAIGSVFSTDLFYHPDTELVRTLTRLGVLAIDMEAAGLYGVAAECGIEALALLVVSDRLGDGARWDAERRREGLDGAARLVLDALLG
jgi:purine-nucleoside phosphorylase